MQITRFENGQPLTADTLNKPLNEIEETVNFIQSEIETSNRPTYLAIYNAKCNNAVSVGDVVCYSNGYINKAAAVFNSTFGPNGELLAEASAYPIGIVTEKQGAVATVVISGKFTPDSTEDVWNNITKKAGTYYLTGDRTKAGTVSTIPSAMPIKVFEVSDDKSITLTITQPPTNYHKHTYCKLEAGWDIESNPHGAPLYKYALDEDTTAYNIVNNFGNSFVFVRDGLIDLTTLYVKDGAIFSTEPISTTSSVYLFTNLPCITDQPIIRALTTTSNRLRLAENNGVVALELDEFREQEETVNSAYAISKIQSDGTVLKTPVISGLYSDGSIGIVGGAHGKYTLTLGGTSKRVYPFLTSLNLTSTALLSDMIVYSFPSNIKSSLHGKFNIPKAPEGFHYKVVMFVEPCGIQSSFTLNMRGVLKYHPAAIDYQNPVSITPNELTVESDISGSIGIGYRGFIESASAMDNIKEAGDIYLSLESTTAAYLCGFGIVLTLLQD